MTSCFHYSFDQRAIIAHNNAVFEFVLSLLHVSIKRECVVSLSDFFLFFYSFFNCSVVVFNCLNEKVLNGLLFHVWNIFIFTFFQMSLILRLFLLLTIKNHLHILSLSSSNCRTKTYSRFNFFRKFLLWTSLVNNNRFSTKFISESSLMK